MVTDSYLNMEDSQINELDAEKKPKESKETSSPAEAVSNSLGLRDELGDGDFSQQPIQAPQSPRMSQTEAKTTSRDYGSLPWDHLVIPTGVSFSSALPVSDELKRSGNTSPGYNALYMAASLFKFNISCTKSEAGYPFLTYQAVEIFDAIGEKGELWLAKNQDDPDDLVGWIWGKHFTRLAAE